METKMTGRIIVLSTCASTEEAERIARHLVDSRLAACVAITPAVRSIYRWQGSIEDAAECALTIKTRADLFPQLRDEILRIHSYETPEIIALPIVDGLDAYLHWIDAETAPPQ